MIIIINSRINERITGYRWPLEGGSVSGPNPTCALRKWIARLGQYPAYTYMNAPTCNSYLEFPPSRTRVQEQKTSNWISRSPHARAYIVMQRPPVYMRLDEMPPERPHTRACWTTYKSRRQLHNAARPTRIRTINGTNELQFAAINGGTT